MRFSKHPMTLRSVATLGGVVVVSLLFPTAAWAATGGSGAPDTPATGGAGAPGGSNVLCAVTVPAAGGTATCSGVTVTTGPTTSGLQVVFSTGTGPACAVTPGVSVSFVDPSTDLAYAGTLTPPATISYANSAVTAGETVLVYNSAAGTWVAPPFGAISSASTTAGVVHVTLSGNGAFSVTTACGSAIAGATVPVTGKPLLGEELLAGVLILGGLGALGLALRRRPVRSASSSI